MSPRTLDSTPKRARAAGRGNAVLRLQAFSRSLTRIGRPGCDGFLPLRMTTTEEGAKAVAVSASVVDARPDGARSRGLFGDAMAGNDGDDFDDDVPESEGSVSASSGKKLRE